MTINPDELEFEDDSLEKIYDFAFENLEDDTSAVCPLFVSMEEIANRYTDPHLIASGGMKQIYQVLDAKANRHVAMAQLHDDAPVDLYDPFIREARLTAILEHPNIISVHDIGADDRGLPFFTMELKVGDSLRTIIEGMNNHSPAYVDYYSHDRLLDIFVKICDPCQKYHCFY